MKKFILFTLIFVVLFSISNTVLAIQIIDPLNAGNFCVLLTRISTGIAGLVATLSGIMIIVAGIMYLTSAGDQQRMTTAKTALKYAILGIVLSILAIPIVEVIKEILGVGSGGC